MAIFDTDEIFATRFAEYCNKKKELDFDIYVFTNQESFNEFIQHNKVELLLLGGKMELDDRQMEHIKCLCYLSEYQRNDLETIYPSIFKYQQAQSLLLEIKSIYTKLVHGTINSNRNTNTTDTKVISLISLSSGENKLLFAWSFAYILSEHKKTLFIPLELLPVQMFSFLMNSNQALSEFIYFLKDNPNSIEKMKSLLCYHGNLTYLSGITHGLDILSLNKEDINKWLNNMRDICEFECIVFYLGCYADIMFDIVGQSDEIITLMTDTSYEEGLLKEWKRQLDMIDQKTEHYNIKNSILPREETAHLCLSSLQELQNSKEWPLAKDMLEKLT